MQLCGKQVIHKVFGKGEIVQYDDSFVQIEFPAGIKKFVFPDAFGVFCVLKDQAAANFVESIIKKRKEKLEKEEEERLKKVQKMRTLHDKRRQRFFKRDIIVAKRKALKIDPRSQSVFWCQAEEIDRVFSEWSVFTGTIKSGQKRGEPKRLARIKQNSAALLTLRGSDIAERERRILGVFMVNESFNVKKCKDGHIPAHSQYRLRLSEQESEQMLFWNYYTNKNHPERMTWNTGRHRYLDNKWVAQILRDIVSLKKVEQEREEVEQFYKYFCQMNDIDAENLPEPNGAILSV